MRARTETGDAKSTVGSTTLDAARWQRLKEVVGDVLELPADRRAAHLDAVDLEPSDRRRVDSLIAAYDEEPDFLEAAGDRPAEARRTSYGAGSRLGDYRVLRKVGEGGMGEVYEVEQEQPIRRRMALKLMRRGRRRDVERFLTERQIMASMSHRNIARVYGAGTVAGRPYLALELIDGPPITRYCDRRELSVEQRLELFIAACHGVQHAHRRGVIHRDLKPSNILVAEEEGQPVPKVIDFGISKSTDSVSQTLTQQGQWLGTPDYMSPEQLLDGASLDTRGDVYSLGVVLYELLTGTLPFATGKLRSEGLDAWVDVLRHGTPPPASERWRRDGGRSVGHLVSAARARRSEPSKLGQRLEGDLDCVLARALEKRPDDRYESPVALARDLRRHLDDLPVEAVEPGRLYAVRKFYRRHRLPVVMATLFVLLLVAGLVGTGLGLQRARQAEREARVQAGQARLEAERANREAKTAQRVTDFMWDVFRASHPEAPNLGAEVTLEALLERGAEKVRRELDDEPLVQARLMNVIGGVYVNLGSTAKGRELLESASALLETEIDAPADLADNLNLRAEMHLLRGELDPALELLRRSLELFRQARGPEHHMVGHVLHDIGRVLARQGKPEQALAAYQRALEVKRLTYDSEHRSVVVTRSSIGSSHFDLGDYAAAIEIQREALEVQERHLGPEHPTLAPTLNNLSLVYRRTGDLEAAEALLMRALAIDRRAYGERHQFVGISWLNLGHVALDGGRCEDAATRLARARSIFADQELADDHPVWIETRDGERLLRERCDAED